MAHQTTDDYTVVMHPVSVRFKDEVVADRLRDEAAARDRSLSALAEQLIDEGLRMRRHPLVTFRDGPTGRRAVLVGGPDIWEVVSAIVGGDIAVPDRAERAVEVLALSRRQVDAALAYYADHTDEIDGLIEANDRAAAAAEASWRRQRELLGR